METALQTFLKKHSLKCIRKIAKGFSGEVFEVQNETGKQFALKMERQKSPRQNMALKEKLFLEKANSAGIGPKLKTVDLEQRIILMEFIDGEPFGKWIFQSNLFKKNLQKVVKQLLQQAKRLDEIGLDHGQLAGKGKNILVQANGKPVIIDFEKASLNRRVHNVSQLKAFLFENPHSAIAKRVRALLNLEPKKH